MDYELIVYSLLFFVHRSFVFPPPHFPITVSPSPSLKFHLGGLGSAGVGLERLFQCQMEQKAIGQTVWEYPDGGMEDLDRFFIAGPWELDPVLCSFQLVLEVLKVLVRFEVRIALDNEHQSGKG